MSSKNQALVPCTCRLDADVVKILDDRATLFRRSRAQEINYLLQVALSTLQQGSEDQSQGRASS